MEKDKNELRLMPNYFKKIGVITILSSVVFVLIIPYFFRETLFFQENKKAMKIFSMDVLLLGGFLYCLAKDKIEDERIMLFRTQAMAAAFIAGGIFTILGPFFDMLFGEPVTEVGGHYIVGIMIFIYLSTFMGKKKSF